MELEGAHKNAYKRAYEKWKKHYEEAKQNPKFWIGFGILLAVILLIWLPPWRVSHFAINNATNEADLENKYRATLAQIIGGFAVLLGLYFSWGNLKVAQKNLEDTQINLNKTQENADKTLINSQEGQITERFTRAVNQLGAYDKEGNPAIEIRLGGIYALERISWESEKDYWPIMEILTAYVRKNSVAKKVDNLKDTILNTNIQDNKIINTHDYNIMGRESLEVKDVTLDIQAIITVISRRKPPEKFIEPDGLNLVKANLQHTKLSEAKLPGAYLSEAILVKADLFLADLFWAHLSEADLTKADLRFADLRFANLNYVKLSEANLSNAELFAAKLFRADLTEADLRFADLRFADLRFANLEGALNLTPDQLSKVRTLYNTRLDEDLRKDLENKDLDKYKALVKKPD